MRVSGSFILPKCIECVDTKRNIWNVRWDFQKNSEGIFTFEQRTFKYKPSINEIQDLIYDWYNKQTDKTILEGFVWKDMPIWLSSENQFNYKAAFDLAMMSEGANLPVKFKFGTTKDPIYYTFETIGDLSDFYMQAMSYINNTLDKGWHQKDNINWNRYK